MNNSENFLMGLLTANISVDAISSIVQKLLPLLSAGVVVVQFGIAVFTLLYVFRKWKHQGDHWTIGK